MAEALRVLRVVGGLDPRFGGPSESAVNACRAAQRAGVRTTLAFPDSIDSAASDATRRALTDEGIELVTFPHARALRPQARRWAVSPRLARWLAHAAADHDVVHVHGAWGASQLAAAMAGRRAARAVVLSPHETLTQFDISGGGPARVLKGPLSRAYVRLVDLFVFSSELERDDSVRVGPAQSLVAAHPVLDERAEPPAAARSRDARTVIGFLGRLHSKKNLPLLLTALAELPDEVTLVVAGDGPEAGRLRADAAKLGVAGRVVWRGFIDQSARDDFFGGIDVLAMPSEYECFGMVAAEALVRGVPAMVSERSGIADLVARHGAGVVAPPEARAVAEALRTLARDPEGLAEMAHRARLAAREELSFGAYGAAITRAYARVAARRR